MSVVDAAMEKVARFVTGAEEPSQRVDAAQRTLDDTQHDFDRHGVVACERVRDRELDEAIVSGDAERIAVAQERRHGHLVLHARMRDAVTDAAKRLREERLQRDDANAEVFRQAEIERQRILGEGLNPSIDNLLDDLVAVGVRIARLNQQAAAFRAAPVGAVDAEQPLQRLRGLDRELKLRLEAHGYRWFPGTPPGLNRIEIRAVLQPADIPAPPAPTGVPGHPVPTHTESSFGVLPRDR
jgi:hypothetical protein